MGEFKCAKCGSTEYVTREKSNGTGIATGLYCAKCGFWHKWINKQEKIVYGANNGAQKDSIDELKAELERVKQERDEWKERAESARRLLQIPTLPDGSTNLAYFEYNGERIQDIVRERNEWKERAQRMHKEALEQKCRVVDFKHREKTLHNQINCAMDMLSEVRHAKRTLEILYISGNVSIEALRDAIKQAKREITEDDEDER